jgi:hypothetical protein
MISIVRAATTTEPQPLLRNWGGPRPPCTGWAAATKHAAGNEVGPRTFRSLETVPMWPPAAGSTHVESA